MSIHYAPECLCPVVHDRGDGRDYCRNDAPAGHAVCAACESCDPHGAVSDAHAYARTDMSVTARAVSVGDTIHDETLGEMRVAARGDDPVTGTHTFIGDHGMTVTYRGGDAVTLILFGVERRGHYCARCGGPASRLAHDRTVLVCVGDCEWHRDMGAHHASQCTPVVVDGHGLAVAQTWPTWNGDVVTVLTRSDGRTDEHTFRA